MVSSIASFSSVDKPSHKAPGLTLHLKGRYVGPDMSPMDDGTPKNRARIRISRDEMRRLVREAYAYVSRSFKDKQIPSVIRLKVGEQTYKLPMNPSYVALYEENAKLANSPFTPGNIPAQRIRSVAGTTLDAKGKEIDKSLMTLASESDTGLKQRLNLITSAPFVRTPDDLKVLAI